MEDGAALMLRVKVDGKTLREARLALGLTQAQLGKLLGVAGNSVARWERGELRIRHPELIAMALVHIGATRNPKKAPSG